MAKGLRELIKESERDPDILAVILFGSYLKKKTRAKDIDICLMLKPKKYTNILMSEKKLEYLSKFPKYDIQIFQQLPSFIQTRILKDGRFLLNKNFELTFKIALASIKEFELFRKHYFQCIKGVAYG